MLPTDPAAPLTTTVGAAREQGASVVLVTHETRVAAYADREIVLRDGCLAPDPVSA